jgi:hypothetical protein
MAGYVRITSTLPIIDVDDSLWTLYVRDPGPDASIAIQICDGFDYDEKRDPAVRNHEFDGEFHEGDVHMFLDADAASRLLGQLAWAFNGGSAEPTDAGLRVVNDREPVGRFCLPDCADCESDP